MQFQYQKQRIINQQLNSAFSLFDGDAGVLTHPLEQQRKQQLEQQQKQHLEQNKIEITNFIKLKMFEKKNYPLNNKKILLLMACHCIDSLKLITIKNNLNYFKNNNIDVVIINSSDTMYHKELVQLCEESNIKYAEVPNNGACDFGKFLHCLQTIVTCDPYEYVLFTNDSYKIHSPIDHFFNFICSKDVDMYGYNDSNEIKYHIQSYLFALKIRAVATFITNVAKKKRLLHSLHDVIRHCELEYINWFQSYACFLNISTIKCLKQNIFYHDDELYVALKEIGLLPFTKLKRLTPIPNTSSYLK